MIYAIAAFAVLLTMFCAILRAAAGPTVFDRILAANMFATKTVLLIATTGFLFGRPEWTDLCLAYALISYVGMLAILRFSKFESLEYEE